MKARSRTTPLALISAGLLALSLGAPAHANPCASRNPCAAKAANPCAAKNPCAAASPCAAKSIKRPPHYKPYQGDKAELVRFGEQLFNDTKLSTNGMACASCHQNYGAYQATFAKPFPHRVAMAEQNYGVRKIHLDEAVQMCMIGPMANKPLAWDSKELAALTAYVGSLQKGFKPTGAKGNPCAAKNPCAAQHK